MLRVKGIEVFYGDLQALRGVSLEVNQGEIVSIIGSNGAGKSTTLMTISGVLKPKRGEIQLDQDFIHQHSSSNCLLGIVQIPEGRNSSHSHRR
jgi:branched-chain amino acid transport system ATP-binding protein